MSFFGKLFSGKKGEPAPTPSEAIQKLRDIENMLTKKQEFLEKKIEVELDTARKNGTKNKRGECFFYGNCITRFIALLKKRKYFAR